MKKQTAMGWQYQKSIGRNNFDFVRFALAVLVIFSHCFPLLHQGSNDYEPLSRITYGQVTFGDLAVDWFFVISGFLITHSWLRSPTTLDYLKKRVLRIYPGFIGSVIFCILIVAPIASPAVRQHFFSEFRALPLIGRTLTLRLADPKNEVFLSNSVHALNGSLWSISYEFWCYIGVILVGYIGLLKRPTAFAAIFTAFIAISLIFAIYGLHPGGGWFFHTVVGSPQLWARMLPFYLAGMTFYLLRDRIPFSRALALGSVILLISTALIPTWGMRLMLPLAGTYLLFWLAFEPKIRLENWAKFGDFSYGIYVFAYPIQQLIIMKFGAHITPLKLFVMATPITIVAGIISWHLIERPFMKMKKKSLPHLLHKSEAAVTAPAT